MNKATSKRILEYMEYLYPEADCELVHENVFQLVVAVMLSAQTTDQSVNRVTPALFERYPTPELLAKGDIKDIEDYIHSIGLYRNKAKNLKAMANVLVEQYNGIVPSSQEELESLPGVGRKTANVVRSVGFGIPAFAVDTHVSRIAKRLDYASKKDTVKVIEEKLTKKIDKDQWNHGHHLFIFFGRYFCKAQQPHCYECQLYDICHEPLRKKIVEKYQDPE